MRSHPLSRYRLSHTLIVMGLLVLAPAARAQAPQILPDAPLSGPAEPRAKPEKGDDGLYRQPWFLESFLDLREDHAEARAKGRRFAVIFEQRGCIYCTKMHTEVLSERWINDYVRENFTIVQLDLWGSREVVDFDGSKFAEKKLAERWGVMFTPTIVLFKEDVAAKSGAWGQPLEVARLPLGFGPATFIDVFAWVRTKAYEQDPNFQRYHIARMAARDALKAPQVATPPKSP